MQMRGAKGQIAEKAIEKGKQPTKGRSQMQLNWQRKPITIGNTFEALEHEVDVMEGQRKEANHQDKSLQQVGKDTLSGRSETAPLLMNKIGFWNVKGLNKPTKQRDVQLHMHNSHVGMFRLLETRIKRNKAHKASLNLCRDWSFVTNLDKHPGGRIWVF